MRVRNRRDAPVPVSFFRLDRPAALPVYKARGSFGTSAGLAAMSGWLTALTMTPLVGAALIAGFDPGRKALARGVGLFFNALALAMALRLWWKFDAKSGELQFVERHDWIPSLNVQYFVGVDGLGLLMVLLAALIVPFALLASSSRHDGEPLPSQTEIGN